MSWQADPNPLEVMLYCLCNRICLQHFNNKHGFERMALWCFKCILWLLDQHLKSFWGPKANNSTRVCFHSFLHTKRCWQFEGWWQSKIKKYDLLGVYLKLSQQSPCLKRNSNSEIRLIHKFLLLLGSHFRKCEEISPLWRHQESGYLCYCTLFSQV